MGGILRFLFPESEGYDVLQEDSTTFKVCCRPGGTFYQYKFLLVESQKKDTTWGATEDQLHDHLSGNQNNSKDFYVMIQIGLEDQFYKMKTFSLADWVKRCILLQTPTKSLNGLDGLRCTP